MLSVDEIVFKRGENGVLIPQERTLNLIEGKPTIKIVPLTKGALQRIHALAKSENIDDKIKSDIEVIKQGLVEPKLTDEQISDLKPNYANAIAIVIMSASLGVGEDKITEKLEDAIQDEEEKLKKK